MRSTRVLPLALILFAGLALAGPRIAAAGDLVAASAPQPARSSCEVGAVPSAASAAFAVAPALAPGSWMGSVAAILAALVPASPGLDRAVTPSPGDKIYCPPWAPCSSSCPMYCDGPR